MGLAPWPGSFRALTPIQGNLQSDPRRPVMSLIAFMGCLQSSGHYCNLSKTLGLVVRTSEAKKLTGEVQWQTLPLCF